MRDLKNMKNIVIIISSYNEIDHIGPLIEKIECQRFRLNSEIALSLLIMDNNSSDGTDQLVQQYALRFGNVHFIKNNKKDLGAFVKGMHYATESLRADVVIKMNADHSHDPSEIPRFITEILNGSDFVIGSRFIAGGSIPGTWSYVRKLSTRFANSTAKNIAKLKGIKDFTSGYWAINIKIFNKVDLYTLKGNGNEFQLSLLYACVKEKARVKEIPIQFSERVKSGQKLKIKENFALFLHTFYLRYLSLQKFIFLFVITEIFVMASIDFYVLHLDRIVSYHFALIIGIIFLSLLMTIQGMVSLFLMLYGWEDPEQIAANRSPELYSNPQHSFTAIIPVKDEEHVIADTLRSISNIDYPKNMKETLIVCHKDDGRTICEIENTIADLGDDTIKLLTFDSEITSKPHGLNIGLRNATKDIVVVFDAEDRPHRGIYNIVNTVMSEQPADVVQSGVQLMNYKSKWFAPMNVLEYFFWFKSSLHFFAHVGFTPLAGNTVFFKKYWLEQVKGWDEDCLTEDADIGIRLSLAGAKIKVIYDEKYVTREEVPTSTESFIKQRTRWNQGFMQIFAKGDWLKLPTFFQKMLAGYILLVPEIQAISFILTPLSLYATIYLKLPVVTALFTIIPFMILLFELIIYNIGMYEFTKNYHLKYRLLTLLQTLSIFYPFQLLLGYSSLRAFVRLLSTNYNWEKTYHANAHGEFTSLQPQYSPSFN